MTKRVQVLVGVSVACVLAAAGVGGCTAGPAGGQSSAAVPAVSAPAPSTPAASDTTASTPCAYPNMGLSGAPDNSLGADDPNGMPAAPDYPDPMSFFDPFSVFDLLGISGTGYDGAMGTAGTSTVGVVIVAPSDAKTAPNGTNLPTGIVGFDAATGKGLWGLMVPHFYTEYSNGTDRLGIVTSTDNAFTLETIDAQTGKVLSSVGVPALGTTTDSPYPSAVLGMVGGTVAVTDGTTVKGLSDDDLSTVVWQRPADTSTQQVGGGVLGQCVLTDAGFAQIDNGTLVGFGADISPTDSAGFDPADSTGYLLSADGSLFHWGFTDVNGVPQPGVVKVDPVTAQPLWNTSIPLNCHWGPPPGAPLITQQAVVEACGNPGAYSLSDGHQLWDSFAADMSGLDGPYTLLGVAGQFVFYEAGSGTEGQNEFAVRIQDGSDLHITPFQRGHGNPVFGQNIVYSYDGQTITAYDATTDLTALWSVQIQGGLDLSSGHFIVAGNNGQVWVAKPQS